MNIIELNDKLYKRAKELNACDTAMSKWNGYLTPDKLIDLWLHHYDFAIDNKFPDNDFIVTNFDKKLLEEKGVYVNKHTIMERNKNGIIAIQGDSTGMLMYDMMSCANIYVRDSARMTISCKGMSKVFINVYDNAKVEVTQRENASVYIYNHSKNSSIITDGEVNIREKIV